MKYDLSSLKINHSPDAYKNTKYYQHGPTLVCKNVQNLYFSFVNSKIHLHHKIGFVNATLTLGERLSSVCKELDNISLASRPKLES